MTPTILDRLAAKRHDAANAWAVSIGIGVVACVGLLFVDFVGTDLILFFTGASLGGQVTSMWLGDRAAADQQGDEE